MKNRISLVIVVLLISVFHNVKSQTSSSQIEPRAYQVSFIPFLGTNGSQSGGCINHVSLNILAGYNGGTTGFELGGLLNIDRYDVKSSQIAGIGNFAGGEAKGVQCAGIYNITQILNGTQIGGVTNVASTASGMQIAGISNHVITGKSVQIGGVLNSTGDRTAFQVAGIANYARISEGVQIAGIANVSKEKSGSQIAGILNVTPYFKGVQIGLINITDSCNGIPIGLLSFVKNGYHNFEISVDELFQANLAFRSGVEKLHIIFIAGIKPTNIGSPLWTVGAGIGTSQSISAKTMFDINFVSQQIIKESDWSNNHLYKFYLGMDRSLNSHMSLAFGITYNFLITDLTADAHPEYYDDIAPYTFSSQSYNRFNLKSWAGFKVGLRFK
jgi:hypothetical protein